MEFCGLTLKNLAQVFRDRNCEPWRASQLWTGVYKRGAPRLSDVRNAGAQAQLAAAELTFPTLQLQKIEPSRDGETHKFLWRLGDRSLVESVLIQAPNRNTICVSSQVGCPAKCSFCASGKEGLQRNLTSGEIVEQILHAQNYLRSVGGRLTNVVYMGMGEPLCNCDAVLESIAIAIEPKGLALSPRKICISTVGVIPGIQRLLQSELRVNLVLSLHAPNQRLRQKLLPFARRYPLDELLELCDAYFAKTGREVNFEYTLIEGINDRPEHARELCQLLGSRQTSVNLIPYNPIDGITFKRPQARDIEAFQAILTEQGIKVTRRFTKGDDIAAACGQLALREKGGASSLVETLSVASR